MIESLWSYATRPRDRSRRAVTVNAAGNQEFWLERSDPLLNTILPSTCVSVIVNAGDPWAAGRSPAMSAFLPQACIVGPFTGSRMLRVGRHVRAIGVVLASTATHDVFGVPAAALVDQIVPLDELWEPERIEPLLAALMRGGAATGLAALQDATLGRGAPTPVELVGPAAVRAIQRRAGRVDIERLARRYGFTRQQFARRFTAAAGMSPKLFARVTRFDATVHALLSTDVSEWASLATEIGFYDQAHMINEFRAFAGAPPTIFFQPHLRADEPSAKVQLRGTPSEWLCP